MIATGYVIALFAGLADIFGMGSHPLPGYPFFGPWQSRGVQIGQLIIGIGLILMLPFEHRNPGSQRQLMTSQEKLQPFLFTPNSGLELPPAQLCPGAGARPVYARSASAWYAAATPPCASPGANRRQPPRTAHLHSLAVR